MTNFHYIDVMLHSFFSLELDEEDIEEIGLIAWKYIGNKNRRLYCFAACIDPKDNSVTMPCNAYSLGDDDPIIEMVTTNFEDWETVTNYSWNGNPNTSFIEENIESQKVYTSPYYMSGKMLDYEQVGNKLYFKHNYGRVKILYKGILADDDGLPELTDKEAMAIATYIAYTQKFKEGLITNNADITRQAMTLKQQWDKQVDQARITYLNQNDMNEILQAKGSWDRASYSKSFKAIK